MSEQETSRAGPSDVVADTILDKQVSARAGKRRRAVSLSEIPSALAAIVTGLTLVSELIPFLNTLKESQKNGVYLILVNIGAVLIVIIGALLIRAYSRRRSSVHAVTSEADINDANLRELISEIAKGQIEFERRLTAGGVRSQLEP